MGALMGALSALKASLKRRGASRTEAEALVDRSERRKRLVAKAVKAAPFVRLALLAAGYAALLVLPTDLLSRNTYISENAIQPGQVNTYWSWGDVAVADEYAKRVDSWASWSSLSRAEAIAGTLAALGFPTATQSYSFHVRSDHDRNGTNAYGILPATRADGAEAIVLMASWLSRAGEGVVNTRGVASVLALAQYLRRYSLWSKDIVFLISDGHLEGAQAWLQAYHGVSQSNAVWDELTLTTGGLWAGLALDYPYHSFDHFELYYEGPNGQLPNLDLINTVSHIARWSGGVPTRLHSHDPDRPKLPSFVPDHPTLRAYSRAGHNLFSQIMRGALNTPSGPEGLFLPFRVSALALYGPPAEGPHGFHAMGKTVESTLRSINNLLERFHQSFTLYLLHSVDRFVSVGNYLFGPILVGVAVTVTGLESWARLASRQEDKSRSIVAALGVIVAAHASGLGLFAAVAQAGQSATAWQAALVCELVIGQGLGYMVRRLDEGRRTTDVPIGTVMRPLVLLSAGAVLSVVSVLSFSTGAVLGVVLGLPLCYPRPALLVPVGIGLAATAAVHVPDLERDWAVLRTWFLPFAFGVAMPWAMQLLPIR